MSYELPNLDKNKGILYFGCPEWGNLTLFLGGMR
jgi:hypothetical protein